MRGEVVSGGGDMRRCVGRWCLEEVREEVVSGGGDMRRCVRRWCLEEEI